MKIRPQHSAADVLDDLQQVMMIAPVDAEKNKAQQVTEKDRAHRAERLPTGVMRHPEFEHHDGDDDRDHPIAESFKPAFGHLAFLLVVQLRLNRGWQMITDK